MNISVSVSKKELIAYISAAAAAVVIVLLVLIFANNLKSKIGITVKNNASTFAKVLANGFAVSDAMVYSEEEIVQEMVQDKINAEKIFEINNLPVIHDFTPEEEAELAKGNLSSEDAIKILSEKNSETNFFINNNSKAENSVVNENIGSKAAAGDADKAIGEKITRLYGLKAYYLGKLGNMLNQAQQEYNSLEKNNEGQTKKIAGKYISMAASLEEECDSKVYEVLGELESELIKNGQSTSVIDSIEEAYIKEKRLKKSYYLTNYMY